MTQTREWDTLWLEYTASLENWRRLLEQMQTASADMQDKFGRVWDKATVESSAETIKLFNENWQKAMGDSGAAMLASFAEDWKKAVSSTGLEQVQSYGEMMKKFAETWNKMWPKQDS
ncbi:MAG: hypothetical protein D9C04_03655 [Nitrosopumilus sp. B06]|nr:MAG: hypothetical protein EB828_03990 [Nitrosopumilus sp. D6]RNJ79777.1 MAG: hypothetical protein D9C04_03655 [Nitrosopumilus sp. B06]